MSNSNELNKYFTFSETKTIFRSEIRIADYNPRTITPEARKQLKKSIKTFGCVGGIVINKQTNNTLVSGHQKISIIDEINHYPENDYTLKVEVIDVDEKKEKELNIFFNNPNAMGEFDYTLLAKIIPDIDYELAGLTETDLDICGIEIDLNVMEREYEQDELINFANEVKNENKKTITDLKEEMGKQTIGEVRRQMVQDSVNKNIENFDCYITLTFSNGTNKQNFLRRAGIEPETKYVKGEEFADMIEFVC